MGAELVRTFDIYQVISRAMGAMNARLLNHGEIVGYIVYNMLKVEEIQVSNNQQLRRKRFY